MKSLFTTMSVAILCTLFSTQLFSQTVTYRFVYAGADCAQDEVCFDVEAQGDQAGLELDEFNMRMFIDDSVLSFIDFRNPDPLYYLETTGNTQSGVAGSGSFFGFAGEFVYITDNYKRVGVNGLILETGANWTYLFQACFNSVSPLAGMNMMCPPLVWDHDTDGSGFAGGSDGIESLLVNPAGGAGISVDEAVVFYNWDYYAPTTDNCFDPNCTILSAELLGFSAESEDCKTALIEWEVATEKNISKYLVERKLSYESDYTVIDEVEALGTSFAAITYTSSDFIGHTSGKVLYRLAEVMEDGSIKYITVTELNASCDNELDVNVYPNPASEYVNIRFDIEKENSDVTISLMDITGKNINQVLLTGTYGEGVYEETISLNALAGGQYIIKAEIGETVTSKIVDIIQE